MALNPLKSHITADKAAWAPYFSVGAFNASTISTQTLTASTINASSIVAYSVSSVLLDAEEINTSTISTIALDLDGQYLTATGSNLLLNGIPIATTANLSSLADWSLEPAISTVQMAGYNINQAGQVSTGSIVGGSAFFTNLMAINSMFLSSYVSTVSSVTEIAEEGYFSTLSTGNLIGGNVDVSTLWGLPSSFYQDAISTISTLASENITCSSLVAANYVSTPDLEVSTINGHIFGENTAVISSLITNQISSVFGDFNLTLTSSLQFNPGFNLGGVNLGLGSLLGNLGGAALGGLGVLVGGAALGTGIAALTQGRQTKNLNSNVYELVNGTTQLQFSTLGGIDSTIYRFVSSVQPNNVPGEEYFVSTIIPAGTLCIRSISDPLNTVSSPNSTIQAFGQWVPLPAETVLSTVSSFSQVYTSSIDTSSITFGGTPALTLKQVATAQLGALDNAGNFGQFGAVEFWSRGSLSDPNFGVFSRSAGNRAQYTDSNLTPHNLLYTQDSNASISSINISSINGQPVEAFNNVSSFQDLGTDVLRVSTINMEGAPGQILWDNGATIYEAAAGRLYITAGTTNVDLQPNQIEFFEGGAGGLMRFFDNHLEVSGISTLAIQAQQGALVSTLNVSTAIVEDRVIILPSTQYAGVWMPFDVGAVPGLYMGLSTGVLTNNYAALAAGEQTPYNEANSRGLTLYQTEDAEVSYQYGDLNVGRIIVAGNTTNYGANPYGYMTGDSGGNLTLHAASVNFSTANAVAANTLKGNALVASTATLLGPSSIILSTSATAGAQSQPAGRLMIGGNDLDLGQQDIWCQQIRLGAGNATNAQTEIIFYDAAAGQRGLQTALQDRTIRVVSTINANQGGYLLDTSINPPFFSTINAGTSTALFAFFPSSVNSTIGASTLSVIPNPIFLAAAASLSSQQVLGANTPLALDLGSAGVNVGGFTLAASTLTVPVAGTYQFSPSIQFNTTTGGSQVVDFWMTKNGADLPNSGSRISVANNAQQIGTVVVCDTAAANDKYGIKIASADANMSAGFFQSTVTTPYTRPAIPSVILNAQRVA